MSGGGVTVLADHRSRLDGKNALFTQKTGSVFQKAMNWEKEDCDLYFHCTAQYLVIDMMMDKYKTVVILCGPVVATSGAQNVTFLWSHRAILKEWGEKMVLDHHFSTVKNGDNIYDSFSLTPQILGNCSRSLVWLHYWEAWSTLFCSNIHLGAFSVH